MSRRKQITIKAKDTSVHDLLVSDLSKRPELADYDMDSIEISIKKKYQPYIQDVGVMKPSVRTTGKTIFRK